jgi:hypothetical protein
MSSKQQTKEIVEQRIIMLSFAINQVGIPQLPKYGAKLFTFDGSKKKCQIVVLGNSAPFLAMQLNLSTN